MGSNPIIMSKEKEESMKLYVVGLGPGDLMHSTERALQVLEESDVITGYSVYVDIVREKYSHKNLVPSAMRQEVDRCKAAVEETLKGQTVSIVCSGDAGIYGMAGLIYEVAQQYDPIEIEIVPGITAACSGSAVLGAPLTHDFAVISLSDLLTPWEQIEKRLECAAMGDFGISLYNPSSMKRKDYLQRACDILLRHKDKETICGYVKNIGREGEAAFVMTLGELRDTQVDMFTTVFIGNSNTKNIDGKMVTPRGYKIGDCNG